MAKYLGSTRRAGQSIAPVRAHRFEGVIVRTRFGPPRAIFVPGMRDLLRDWPGDTEVIVARKVD